MQADEGFISRNDLRAAVAAGRITEAQAASVLALAESRHGARQSLEGRDEPFELFKGFNEIFIVVGLSILFLGWVGITGLSSMSAVMISQSATLYAAIALAVLTWLARYFTLKRRMVAPSIALTAMVGLSAAQFGAGLTWTLGLNYQERIVGILGLATVIMALWYLVFRIPITVAFVALGVFTTLGAAFALGGAALTDPRQLFLLSAEGPFSVLTIVLGLIGLGVAMAFDMSDPHRVSRRAASGFWLHVIAAPAIVNTVALTLLDIDTVASKLMLLAFLTLIAIFAVVIDRRSFLIAGAGYVVALSFLVLQDGAMLAILVLGLGLVLLGAQWERLRGALMGALPAFPGKGRLPPWQHG